MILVALLLVVLAVVLPAFLQRGWRQGMLALGLVAALALALVALAWTLGWLLGTHGGEGCGWRSRFLAASGHLFRFLLCGLIAAILGVALIAEHGLGVGVENSVAAVSGGAGGLAGCLLYWRLGARRFWTAFRRLGLALLGSFLGGILGLLGPEKWGVTLGVLVPLLVFAIFASAGRIVPPRAEAGDGKGGP